MPFHESRTNFLDGGRLMGSGQAATPHPSAEEISAFLESRLSETDRERLMAHLVECAPCRREVSTASRLVRTAPRGSRWSSRVVVAVIAAGLTFVLVPRYLSRDSELDSDRPQRVVEPDAAASIAVVSPADGESVRDATVRLVWRAHAPSTLYRVTVQDSVGAVRWSVRTADTIAMVPDSVRVSPGATYYWSVDALGADGRNTTSRTHWFRR